MLTPVVRAIVMIIMQKHTRCYPLLLLSVFFAGCLPHEGTYAPGCMAYAGDKITLSDGSFVWEKFTDAVVVDDDGNVVNQFPGFPSQGRYQIDGQIVQMNTTAGDALDNMYLQESGGKRYLLTEDEFAAWEQTGKREDCTLQLISESES
jgi:hypothetical protein